MKTVKLNNVHCCAQQIHHILNNNSQLMHCTFNFTSETYGFVPMKPYTSKTLVMVQLVFSGPQTLELAPEVGCCKLINNGTVGGH